MCQPTAHKDTDQAPDGEKVPFVVAKRVREAILDEVFKPGDHLTEAELVEKFEVSRSPVREALVRYRALGPVKLLCVKLLPVTKKSPGADSWYLAK
jgi:DNA-binding GntR family transcriptional regulator